MPFPQLPSLPTVKEFFISVGVALVVFVLIIGGISTCATNKNQKEIRRLKIEQLEKDLEVLKNEQTN